MTTHRDGTIPLAEGETAGADAERAAGWLDPGEPNGADRCGVCGSVLADRYGWCSGCRVALCVRCGRAHFCRPTCAANGCRAGLCVREVRDGVLSERWGLPVD